MIRRATVSAIALLLAACSGSGGGALIDGEAPTPEAPTIPAFDLCINEFMTSNSSGIQDETGEWADWVELHNPTDEAVSLDGWTLSDNPEEPERHVFAADASIGPGGFLLLWADGDVDAGPDHVGFGLASDGGSLTLGGPGEQSSTLHYGPLGADRAAARTSDCCPDEGCFESVAGGTPGRPNDGSAPPEEILLGRGSRWMYFDGADPGDGWMDPDHDLGGWDDGFAPLGYGNYHVTTDVNDSRITVWFAVDFAVIGADEFDRVPMRLLRDAGAVVYLNGVEVDRSNLPAGTLTPQTLATRSVQGQEEVLYFPL